MINNSFKPKGIFLDKDFEKMADLYSKYRASQCADELSKSIGEPISEKSVLKLVKNDILIHYDFSRKHGLFEVKKYIRKSVYYYSIPK